MSDFVKKPWMPWPSLSTPMNSAAWNDLEDRIDAAFTAIVLTPGPQGPPGATGATGPAGSDATVPDADGSTKGKVQLAGDLSGTAAAPTVPDLATKVDGSDGRLSDTRVPKGSAGGALGGTYPNPTVPGLASKVDTGDGRLSDSRTPSGSASGDLGGSYPDPTVPGLAGKVGTSDSRLMDARTPTAHNHPLSEVTDSGTSAALDVPVSGDAASGQVVKGNDGRLTDSRSPSAHTHEPGDVKTTGGSADDVLTIDGGEAKWVTPAGGGGGGITEVRSPTSAYTLDADDVGVLFYVTIGGTLNFTVPTSTFAAGDQVFFTGSSSGIPQINGSTEYDVRKILTGTLGTVTFLTSDIWIITVQAAAPAGGGGP